MTKTKERIDLRIRRDGKVVAACGLSLPNASRHELARALWHELRPVFHQKLRELA